MIRVKCSSRTWKVDPRKIDILENHDDDDDLIWVTSEETGAYIAVKGAFYLIYYSWCQEFFSFSVNQNGIID